MLFSTALLTLLAASASAVPAPAPFTVEGLRRRQDAPIAEQIAATKAKYAQTNKLALLSIAEGLLPKTIGDVLSQLGLKQRRAAVALTDNASGGVDIDYYGATLIGTPSQTIQQDFDTGSSDLWVPVNCNNCGSTPQYKASSSSTYKATTTPFKIQYGSGDVNGTVAFDAVKLGGYSTSSQALGAASSVSSQFANSPSSGLTGLAWPAIASIRNQPTLTQSLKVPVYGYSIHRSSSSKSNYLDVGALVSSRYTGNISYTNVVSKTYWQVSATGFSVNGKSASGSFYAAIDTGTTLLYAPSSAVASFWSAIPGSSSNGDGSYSYPCNFAGTVGISFANTGVIKMSNADLKYYQSTSTTCVGSVIAQDFSDAYGNPLAIVGDVFLKSQYTIFDVSNARVGFATST